MLPSSQPQSALDYKLAANEAVGVLHALVNTSSSAQFQEAIAKPPPPTALNELLKFGSADYINALQRLDVDGREVVVAALLQLSEAVAQTAKTFTPAVGLYHDIVMRRVVPAVATIPEDATYGVRQALQTNHGDVTTLAAVARPDSENPEVHRAVVQAQDYEHQLKSIVGTCRASGSGRVATALAEVDATAGSSPQSVAGAAVKSVDALARSLKAQRTAAIVAVSVLGAVVVLLVAFLAYYASKARKTRASRSDAFPAALGGAGVASARDAASRPRRMEVHRSGSRDDGSVSAFSPFSFDPVSSMTQTRRG